ncbi:MAG: hypothetical protein JWP89_3979 [Schlesneria sp.]|nr:hypothetical protein [Schlesneria sp.]
MHTFFNGWRRKAGVVTLVMAVAMCSLWMRANLITDEITFQIADRRHTVISLRDGVIWISLDGHLRQTWMWESSAIGSAHLVNSMAMDITDVLTLIGNIEGLNPNGWVISHRNLVIPFTLLSAYLILWKPRKKPLNA